MNRAAVRAVQGGFKPHAGVDLALKLISDCPKVESSGIGWYRVRDNITIYNPRFYSHIWDRVV